MGLQARLMRQALRKLTETIHKTQATVVFINQVRNKIGVMFGSPETTTGGNALKFYASVRLDVRRIQALKDGELPIGNRTRVKVVKNKLAPPFREAEFDILVADGVCRLGELIDLGEAAGIIEKSRSWFSLREFFSPEEGFPLMRVGCSLGCVSSIGYDRRPSAVRAWFP
jgi:recombination protein RecA